MLRLLERDIKGLQSSVRKIGGAVDVEDPRGGAGTPIEEDGLCGEGGGVIGVEPFLLRVENLQLRTDLDDVFLARSFGNLPMGALDFDIPETGSVRRRAPFLNPEEAVRRRSQPEIAVQMEAGSVDADIISEEGEDIV